MYKSIDVQSWERNALFTFFQTFENPTWDISADLDITRFYQITKKNESSFFLSFLYIATKVGNSIDAFRQRILDDGSVIEFDVIHPGSTVLYDNQTFGFGYFNYQDDFRLFLEHALVEFENQKDRKNMDPKDEDLGRFYFSPIPWISFTSFRHPFRKDANHSIPLIVFGKHYERDGLRLMPVGLTLHHGLADGYHAGLFFNRLQEALNVFGDFGTERI